MSVLTRNQHNRSSGARTTPTSGNTFYQRPTNVVRPLPNADVRRSTARSTQERNRTTSAPSYGSDRTRSMGTNQIQDRIDSSRYTRGDSNKLLRQREFYEEQERRRRSQLQAPDKYDLTRRTRPDSFTQERIRLDHERQRVNSRTALPERMPNRSPALPKFDYPAAPKTNFPTRLPRPFVPRLPLPPFLEFVPDVLFPDPLNTGEDEALDQIARERERFRMPEINDDSFPLMGRGIAAVMWADVFNMSLNSSSLNYNEREFFIQRYDVFEPVVGVQSRFKKIIKMYDGDALAAYQQFWWKTVRGTYTLLGAVEVGLRFVRIVGFYPYDTPELEQGIELPPVEGFVFPGIGTLIPPAPGFEIKVPSNGVPQLPEWRPPTAPGQPKTPWKPWNDVGNPIVIRPPKNPVPFTPEETPTVRPPLPPHQEFRPPPAIQVPDRKNQICSNDGDCMACQFNPAVIQRIVQNDGTQSRALDNANRAVVVGEVIQTRTAIAGLEAKIAGVMTQMNLRFTSLANWLRLPQLLNLLILATVFHNAIMLSGQAVQGVAELMSQVLAIFGMKNEDGQAISVQELVGKGIQDIITTAIGAEEYKKLTENWAKANRIIQASSNVLNSVRTMFASTQQLITWAADNTGKIGNALKRDGVVRESAFNWMPENNSKAGALGGLMNGVDGVTNTTSSLTQVTSDVLTLQQESLQIKENMGALTKEFDNETKEKTSKHEATKPTAKDGNGKTIVDGNGNPVPSAQANVINQTQPSDLKKADPVEN